MIEIDKNKLIESYLKHKSIRKVALEYGISHETVRYKLKDFDILNKSNERYLCNKETLFSKEIQESFYWAGFIAADGCVKLQSNKKYLSIGLEKKDHVQMEKFKSTIGFEGPIHIVQRIDCVSSEVCIRSDKIFDDLARFNIIPRKSLVLTFPEWLVNHQLVNHFMRGYFDGDGSFYIPQLKNGRTIKQLYFSLRGTKEFLTTYKNILEKECKLEHSDKKPRKNSGIYTLEYGGNRKVLNIRDFLYKSSIQETRLDRKYDLSHSENFNLPEDFKFSPVIGENIITGKTIQFKSIKEAKNAGFTGSAISACCSRKYKSHKGYTWKYVEK